MVSTAEEFFKFLLLCQAVPIHLRVLKETIPCSFSLLKRRESLCSSKEQWHNAPFSGFFSGSGGWTQSGTGFYSGPWWEFPLWGQSSQRAWKHNNFNTSLVRKFCIEVEKIIPEWIKAGFEGSCCTTQLASLLGFIKLTKQILLCWSRRLHPWSQNPLRCLVSVPGVQGEIEQGLSSLLPQQKE